MRPPFERIGQQHRRELIGYWDTDQEREAIAILSDQRGIAGHIDPSGVDTRLHLAQR